VPTGGRNVAWQPSRAWGQSSGGAVLTAALTSPRAAGQTGVHCRPLVREPGVAWTPRRQRLGGVCDGGAVDDGGVGPRPTRPNYPAASALCRLVRCLRRAQVSLGHCRGRAPRPPATALRQRLAAPARAAPCRCLGRPRRLRPSRRQCLLLRSCPHVLGKTVRTDGRTAAASGASASCLPGEPWRRARRGKATEGIQAGEGAHVCGRVARATVSRRRR
jgi:hypothetical protein